MRTSTALCAPVIAVVMACAKTESAKTPAADSTAAPALAPVSAPAPVDSVAKPSAPSAAGTPTGTTMPSTVAKPAAPAATPTPAKLETGDYDKATRPKFRINEKTGKVDTIKKP